MTRLNLRKRDIEETLANLISEIAKIPRDLIVEGSTVDEELRMESVAFVELQVAIEEIYNVEVDPIRMIELNEFSAIVNYLFGVLIAGDDA